MAETEQRLAEIEARANRLRHLAVTVHKEDDDRRVVGFEAKRHECAPSDLLRITSEALWLLTTLRAAEARVAKLEEALSGFTDYVALEAFDEMIHNNRNGRIIGWKKTDRLNDLIDLSRNALEDTK